MQMSLNNIGLRIARMFPKLPSWQAVTVHVLCLVPPSLSCAFSRYLAPAPPGVTLQTCSKTPAGPQLRRNENFKNASNCILAKSLQSCQPGRSSMHLQLVAAALPEITHPSQVWAKVKWSSEAPSNKTGPAGPQCSIITALLGPILFSSCVHMYWESAALQWALHGVRTAATWRSAGEGEGERREGGRGRIVVVKVGRAPGPGGPSVLACVARAQPGSGRKL